MIPKYRAWDKELQTMLDVSLIDFKKGVLVGEHWEFGETNFMNFDEIVLMQSTGLFDRNGKEIFEGDVLTSQNYPVKGVVEFRTDLGLWVHYLKRYSYFEYLGNVAGSKEIIGNIYENPELLEVKE
ncbi:TPA: DNA-packaging protein [Streptococcus pneumoniae]|nr:DNA-packaging protein [Streptococcus pneumoniae]